jgi:Ca2+-transporting ATPase
VVATKAGFANCNEVITGAELDGMSDALLQERIKTVNVFARVVPEQKLRIVEALKANGDIAVMTGDGVNDAPALKASAVGIAMGGRGTEVARESSALVLTDDNFTSIVRAVRMGRRIYDNIKKAMGYIISVHMPIAGISLIPVLFGWPIVLFPVHIAFLELIIDPVCSVVFEAEGEEKNIMRRKPRRKDEPLFDRATLLISALRGLVLLAIVAFVYWNALETGADEHAARTITFATLVLGNLALVLSSRSQSQSVVSTLGSKNDALLVVIGATLFCLVLVFYVPFLQELFEVSAPSLAQLALAAGCAFAAMIVFEVLKAVNKR